MRTIARVILRKVKRLPPCGQMLRANYDSLKIGCKSIA
jgi:hypothetical protein